MNVVYLVLDTLRADHMGCYGYKKNTSPNMDRLASEGVLFENAFPSDVPTQPSFTAMFTGLRGIHTGVVSHSYFEDLDEETPFLPELLAQNGVTTGAVSTLYTMRRWFARGFQYNMNPAAGNRRKLQQVDAEEINALAIPWIEDHRDEPFFLFLHYWDPHGLYKPPERYRSLFYDGDPYDPENHSLDRLKASPVWSFTKNQIDAIGENITDRDYVVSQYDSEIRYVDDQVQVIFDTLEKQGLADDTMIILTADHGESMGEHDFYFDHFEVYDTTIHVPLIMKHPKLLPKGKRVDELIQSTISLAPTVLNLYNIMPPERMKGKDLVKIANGQGKGYPEIISNQGLWTAKRAIRTKDWKLIKTTHKAFWDTPPQELYRIDEDPNETNNLAESHPEIVDMLELRLSRFLESELQGKVDPLDLAVSRGLPVYEWVELVAKRNGMLDHYEEWRSRVDRGESSNLRKGPIKPPSY
ncbi:sulfatase [Candidatus Bathyarchaeota archaeon]|nr:sulfatase [Candidatus Bathyarchaeota archaeon]